MNGFVFAKGLYVKKVLLAGIVCRVVFSQGVCWGHFLYKGPPCTTLLSIQNEVLASGESCKVNSTLAANKPKLLGWVVTAMAYVASQSAVHSQAWAFLTRDSKDDVTKRARKNAAHGL
eukprot:5311365-Amphidinium_carterae.1